MRRSLGRLERKVQKGLTAFREAGAALAEIRDQHLYKQNYDTFEEYVIHRWGMSRQHAYRLIDGAQIAELLTPAGDKEEAELIQHEAHTRALIPLKDKPDELRVVWEAVNREHPGEVTAEVVRSAVRERMHVIEGGGESEPEPEPEEPKRIPLTVHVDMHMTQADAREALRLLLDIKPAPSALAELRSQIQSQLVKATSAA